MKKLLAILVLVILGGTLISTHSVEASYEFELDCSQAWQSAILNDCNPQNSVKKHRSPVGFGVDLILYEGNDGEISHLVTEEYKYDWSNGEHSAFTVLTVKSKDVISAIKGLFNKDGEQESQ